MPKPSENDFSTFSRFSPATIPTVSAPKIRARNGCSLTHVISTTITAMPARKARMSCQPDATGWANLGASARTVVKPSSCVLSSDPGNVFVDNGIDALIDVDGGAALVGLERFKCLELRGNQRGGHEMPGPAGLPPGHDLDRAIRCRNSTSGQCRRSWSRYLRFSAEQLMTPPSAVRGKPLADHLEPRVAVVVVEGVSGGHLRDVGRRMEVVGIGERRPKSLRKRGTDSGLPRTGYSHDHDR